jgi:3-hydroxyisobutyrate dehydrogenase
VTDISTAQLDVFKPGSTQQIVFIGQGKRAELFAARLRVAGFSFAECKLSAPRTNAQTKELAQTVANAGLVITALENPQEVEAVYLGEHGILAGVKPGSYLLDVSLCTPRLARELHALASLGECFFVEACEAGNAAGCEAGSTQACAAGDAAACAAITNAATVNTTNTHTTSAHTNTRLFVGGDTDTVQTLQPVFEALSTSVLLVGLAGQGASAKLAATICQAGAMMALVETITFALNSKVEPASILAMFATDPYVTPAMCDLAHHILDEQFENGPSLEVFFDELTVALDAADELDLAFPVLETAHQLYDLLMMVGGNHKALQALALVYREEAYCEKQGLDWGLAQRAMDVYEQAANFGFEYFDSYEDDECTDPSCGHRRYSSSDDDDYPRMDDYFSSN